MNKGSWVVGKEGDQWTYPGRITCIVQDTVIFEIFDFGGKPYEIHRQKNEVRLANKNDFDKLILDATAAQVNMEKFISEAYEFQKEVP